MAESARILIVDDETAVCDYLADQLDSFNYRIDICHTGAEAISHLQRHPCDLVLLDIHLPDRAGYRVMDHVNQNELDCLVILMTGYASPESAIKALPKGAYDYLRKPLMQAELLKTVQNALTHKRLLSAHLLTDRALAESEKSLRELIDHSLIGMLIVQDDAVVFQNLEQQKLFGRLSLSGDINPAEFVHPEDREKVMAAYRSIRDAQVPTIELDFRFYADGNIGNQTAIKWVQCRASRINYHGKAAVLVNMMDISRSKELESLVMIKHKMTALGGVAAGIAHEIRNPLTGINSYLYTLKDVLLQPRIEKEDLQIMGTIADQIQTASNKIEAVIQRVLNFSKPSTPRMTPIDINAAIQSAIDMSAVTLRKGHVRITADLAADLSPIYGDTHLIEQVILNLITNADRAMKNIAEDRRIQIRTQQTNQSVIVKVSDSGPGVPVDLREKVFDPFFTTRSDGSGIGLSIVQRIIADHNGTIHIDSSRWGGAEFVLKLPIEKRKTPR